MRGAGCGVRGAECGVRMRNCGLIVVVAIAFAAACARAGGPRTGGSAIDGAIVDLSHEYSADAIFWPTAEKP